MKNFVLFRIPDKNEFIFTLKKGNYTKNENKTPKFSKEKGGK